MAPNKSPAFQFYANDFTTGTASMSLQEVGAYMRLLCYEWDHGAVPNDANERARILGCAKAQEREIWKKVSKKFVLENDAYFNERMEGERKKQSEYRRRQSDKGKASAAARSQPDGNHGSTTVQPSHQPEGQPDGNSSVFSLQSSEDPAKNAGSGGVSSTPTPQNPIIDRRENLKWGKKHSYHVSGFCDWCCLDEQQAAEFADKIPGDDYALKLKQIKAWALDIRRQWAGRIVPDGSHFDFWRNRWTETHGGSRPANATLKAVRAASDLDEAFR